jgi:hypothetical protein
LSLRGGHYPVKRISVLYNRQHAAELRRSALPGVSSPDMADDDWLRSHDWNPLQAAHFEAKLARSRRKAYHLLFRSGSLSESSEPASRAAGRTLAERVLRDFPDDLPSVAEAHELVARAFAEAGEVEAAMHHYRQSLAAHARFEKGHAYHGNPALDLTELLLNTDDPTQLREAAKVLATLTPNEGEAFLLVEDGFRHALLSARVAARLCKPLECAKFAAHVLTFEDAGSLELSEELRNELRRLATA